MRRGSLFLLALVLFISYVYGEAVTKIVAKVNAQIITSQDSDEYCEFFAYQTSGTKSNDFCQNKKFRREALERLIEDKLILLEAKNEGIVIPSSLIEEKLNRTISSYPSREEFERSLAEKGLNIALVKEKIKDQYLMRRIVEKHVKAFVNISPQEVNNYYKKKKGKFYSPIKYIFYIAKSKDTNLLQEVAQMIEKDGIIEAEKRYEDILIKVEASEKELRDDIYRVIKDLKWRNFIIKEFDEGFYLLYLEDIVKPSLLSLDQARDEINLYLGEEKFKEKFDEWSNKLKEKAVIKYYE